MRKRVKVKEVKQTTEPKIDTGTDNKEEYLRQWDGQTFGLEWGSGGPELGS